MAISKYNSEGYYDPTAYLALSAIEKEEKAALRAANFRLLVYICSPYSGNIETNTEKARKYSRFAVDRNTIPFAPHLLLPQYMSEDTERDSAMIMNKVFLSKCDEVWVFGRTITTGMAYEIENAEKHNKPIRYFTEGMEEIKCR